MNYALKTDLNLHQWASLGNLSAHACFSIPQSCGAAGGAISVWINIIEAPDALLENDGIISSSEENGQGFSIYYLEPYIV